MLKLGLSLLRTISKEDRVAIALFQTILRAAPKNEENALYVFCVNKVGLPMHTYLQLRSRYCTNIDLKTSMSLIHGREVARISTYATATHSLVEDAKILTEKSELVTT